MERRIFDFKTFVNESYESNVNEGFFTTIGDYIKKATGWAKDFFKAIKDGIIPKYPEGPRKGLPVAMYFSQENGSVYDQVKKWAEGELQLESQEFEDLEEANIPLEYTGEDQSVRNVHADDLMRMILKLYRAKDRGGRAKPIFIYGAPGIGKTEIVYAAAKAADEAGIDVMPLDLQYMNPEDLLGIPSTHEVEPVKVEGGVVMSRGKGFSRANPTTLLPADNGPRGKGGIIFMDEMNRANSVVLNSVMQFVQQGRIQEYKLPDKWIIVAAGNRPGEGENIADLDFALADRFTVVNYVPTVERWSDWAKTNSRILPELVSFLTFKKDLFHAMDTDKKSLNFPTPRSWSDGAFILHDEVIDTGAESWRDLPMTDIRNIFADQVGPTAAGAFAEYLEVLKSITEEDIRRISEDPDGAPLQERAKKNPSVLYGLMDMAIGYRTDDEAKTAYNIMKYFSRYNQLEVLSALLIKIKNTYMPDAMNASKGTEEEQEYKQLMLELVQKGAADRGL